MLFSERTLLSAYKSLVEKLPDAASRISLRTSKNSEGEQYFSYVNHMTIKRYKKLLKELDLEPVYYLEIPLRRYFKPLAKLPYIKEMFVKMVVCVLEK